MIWKRNWTRITEPLMMEMSRRILEAEESGQEVNDGLVGQILTDMMSEADQRM